MKSYIYIALALIALASFSCKTKQVAQDIIIPMGGSTAAVAEETAPVAGPEVVMVPIEETTDVRSEQFELAVGNTTDLHKYHVVVGSFKNKTNAENLNATLIKEGNKSVIVINENGMYRVIIASFDPLKDAVQKRNSLRNRFHDVWLLVQDK